MRILLLLCVVAGTLATTDFAREWNSFKVEYQKVYKNQKEELHRRKIFLENKKVVDDHNELFREGKVSYTLKVNQFSDLHPDEFRASFLGNGLRGAEKKSSPHVVSAKDIPNAVDWRNLNPKAIYPVQFGAVCESSWAFSAIASMAGQLWLRKNVEIPPVSAQNLIDCTYDLGNSGCEGGTVENAFTYIKNNGGLDTEEAYWYEGGDGSDCRYNATNLVSAATVTGWKEIESGNENALMEAVATIGPVAVSVGAYDNAFMMYRGGLYDPNPSMCTLGEGPFYHMVMLVGYGSEGGKNFWIIQNNWGNSWGEGGYMRLVRNGKNTCGIATKALYPTVE